MASSHRLGAGSMRASRRSVIKGGLATLVAAGTAGVTQAGAQNTPGRSQTAKAPAPAAARANGPLFFDVETTSGVVRGIANTGIKIFRGVSYGADTSGRNRFMPPHKPAAWAGVRKCLGYGPISPQTMSGYRSDYSQMIMWDRHVGCGGMGEDCLTLNVWTPGVHDNAKRAVVVRRTRRRRLLVSIFVSSPAGLAPAPFSVNGSISENEVCVSSADVVMNTR